MGGLFIIALLVIAFGIFMIYVFVKQVEFFLHAADLYRDMISRQDKVIQLLTDIKETQQKAVSGGKAMSSSANIERQSTRTPAQKREQKHTSISTNTGGETSQQRSTSPKIKVYKRGTSDVDTTTDDETAKVDDNQDFDNDSIPIRVKSIAGEEIQPSYESTSKFHCPYCHKLYEVDEKSRNFIFRCLKCEGKMMVHISR